MIRLILAALLAGLGCAACSPRQLLVSPGEERSLNSPDWQIEAHPQPGVSEKAEDLGADQL